MGRTPHISDGILTVQRWISVLRGKKVAESSVVHCHLKVVAGKCHFLAGAILGDSCWLKVGNL